MIPICTGALLKLFTFLIIQKALQLIVCSQETKNWELWAIWNPKHCLALFSPPKRHFLLPNCIIWAIEFENQLINVVCATIQKNTQVTLFLSIYFSIFLSVLVSSVQSFVPFYSCILVVIMLIDINRLVYIYFSPCLSVQPVLYTSPPHHFWKVFLLCLLLTFILIVMIVYIKLLSLIWLICF